MVDDASAETCTQRFRQEFIKLFSVLGLLITLASILWKNKDRGATDWFIHPRKSTLVLSVLLWFSLA